MINQYIFNTTPVSVVIPCYKCATTIYRAIESVVNQTKKPAEIILVDDASGDETIGALRSLKKQYGDWIKVVELPKNVGAASARNAGWLVATQPYIAFLDSDDAWHPKKVEIQYQYMVDNPEVILSGHSFLELTESASEDLNWPVEIKSIKKITLKELLLKNQFITPSVMLKKDTPFKFSEKKRHMEDHLLWLEIVGAKLTAVKLNANLAAIYKPMFGASGLSSNMWLMEKADLSNYRYLYMQKRLRFYQYLFLQSFSIVKFFRRLIVLHIVRPVVACLKK